jgi:hypothetical protein
MGSPKPSVTTTASFGSENSGTQSRGANHSTPMFCVVAKRNVLGLFTLFTLLTALMVIVVMVILLSLSSFLVTGFLSSLVLLLLSQW